MRRLRGGGEPIPGGATLTVPCLPTDLPVWFEAAYNGDVEEVGRKISLSDNHKIEIVTAQGINSDQANKGLWQKLWVKSELFELYDSSWVLLAKKEASAKNNSYPYFAAAVLLIDNKEE